MQTVPLAHRLTAINPNLIESCGPLGQFCCNWGRRGVGAARVAELYACGVVPCLSLSRSACRVYLAGTTGPVVFCLHGGGYSGLTWALLAKPLKGRYHCSHAHANSPLRYFACNSQPLNMPLSSISQQDIHIYCDSMSAGIASELCYGLGLLPLAFDCPQCCCLIALFRQVLCVEMLWWLLQVQTCSF